MRCFIKSCQNRRYERPFGISFHKFPKDITLRQKWLDSIGCPDAKVSAHECVCAEHFLFGDLFRLNRRSLLRSDAVPKLKLDSNQSILPERKTIQPNTGMRYSHKCHGKEPSTDEKLRFHSEVAVTVMQQLPGHQSNIEGTRTNIEPLNYQEETLYTTNVDEIPEDSMNRQLYGHSAYTVVQLLPGPEQKSNIEGTRTNTKHPNSRKEMWYTKNNEIQEDSTVTTNLNKVVIKDYPLEIRKLERRNSRLKEILLERCKVIRKLQQRARRARRTNLKLNDMVEQLKKENNFMNED